MIINIEMNHKYVYFKKPLIHIYKYFVEIGLYIKAKLIHSYVQSNNENYI